MGPGRVSAAYPTAWVGSAHVRATALSPLQLAASWQVFLLNIGQSYWALWDLPSKELGTEWGNKKAWCSPWNLQFQHTFKGSVPAHSGSLAAQSWVWNEILTEGPWNGHCWMWTTAHIQGDSECDKLGMAASTDLGTSPSHICHIQKLKIIWVCWSANYMWPCMPHREQASSVRHPF